MPVYSGEFNGGGLFLYVPLVILNQHFVIAVIIYKKKYSRNYAYATPDSLNVIIKCYTWLFASSLTTVYHTPSYIVGIANPRDGMRRYNQSTWKGVGTDHPRKNFQGFEWVGDVSSI